MFLNQLKYEDLLYLRKRCKEWMVRCNYPSFLVTDLEADKMIEQYGERAAQSSLKAAIDARSMRGY